MTDKKESILLSDVTVQGDLVEKGKITVDSKITGDITAEEIEVHENSNINGNINSKKAHIGGKIKGNLSSEKIHLKETSNVEGVLSQKSLKIDEGAVLKIKSETYK